MNSLTKDQIRAARIVAGLADAIQIFFFPFFVEGFISPWNDLLDAATCILLSNIVGFHWVFIPSVLMENTPVLDEAPTWTLALMYALRNRPVIN